MLPSITVLNSVEMIRDGGSLAASFQGKNGSEYWLFFRLRQRTLPSGMFERLGYAKPVVVERQVGTEIEISWEHALILINQIRPLLRQSQDVEWLDAMQATAIAKGELPAKVERFLGPVISLNDLDE
jgi:hypothetical protein